MHSEYSAMLCNISHGFAMSCMMSKSSAESWTISHFEIFGFSSPRFKWLTWFRTISKLFPIWCFNMLQLRPLPFRTCVTCWESPYAGCIARVHFVSVPPRHLSHCIAKYFGDLNKSMSNIGKKLVGLNQTRFRKVLFGLVQTSISLWYYLLPTRSTFAFGRTIRCTVVAFWEVEIIHTVDGMN